jgi:hypothetical protein
LGDLVRRRPIIGIWSDEGSSFVTGACNHEVLGSLDIVLKADSHKMVDVFWDWDEHSADVDSLTITQDHHG